MSLITVLWSEGLPQHSTNTEQIQCHMVIDIISVFSSASSWLCCLLALYECTNVDARMYMVFVFMYMVCLMYSALDKSNMHVHTSWERVVSSVSPPSRHSLSLWPPPSEGHTWVGSELRDYRVEVEPNSLAADSQRHKSACWSRPGPRSLWGVGDAAGGQAELERSCCLDLCFHVKMNVFPSVCKHGLLRQEIIITVLTCCWCALHTHENMLQS